MNRFLLLVFYFSFFSFGLIYADSNGVWHNPEDIRGGNFGIDEVSETAQYSFFVPVNVNSNFFLSGLNVGDFLGFLNGRITTNTQDIITLNSRINLNEFRIKTLDNRVNLINSDLNNKIISNANKIDVNSNRINLNQNSISSNYNKIISNLNDINSNSARITSNLNKINSNYNSLNNKINSVNSRVSSVSSRVSINSYNINRIFGQLIYFCGARVNNEVWYESGGCTFTYSCNCGKHGCSTCSRPGVRTITKTCSYGRVNTAYGACR